MKSDIKDVSPTQKEITVEIDADLLKDAYGRVSKKYAQRANVPGFRKGYAPLDVVRLRFKDEIRSDVLQEVVPGIVTEAIKEHDLHPLSEPHLHLDDAENAKVNGSVPLSLHVHVEVMPDVPEPRYDNIEVTRRVKPVEDNAVEDLINDRIQKEAAFMPVEGRRSQEGDTVIVDIEGTFADDAEAEPIKAEDLEIVLGDGSIETAFTENLVGVSDDEEKEFTVTYGEDFSSEALAGKTIHYKAKVKSVGRTEVPELNDEWAKSLDEGYGSLKELRRRLKSDLEKMQATDADARVRNEVMAKLIENNPLEVPNTLIENQARNLLNNFAQDLQHRGVNINKLDRSLIEMAYKNMLGQAERDVKGALLLEKVAELENVSVSDAEVDEEIARMAEYYKASADEIRESLEKQGGGTENIRNNLKTRKTIEALAAKARITDGEWIDENAPAANEKKPKAKPRKKKAAKEGAGSE